MSNKNTSNVYVQVIEDVINKIRNDFHVCNDGPGETVLNQLRGVWEKKMMVQGSIIGQIERSSSQRRTPGGPFRPLHDLNVPYEGTEEYEIPTTELLFPPTPMHTPFPGSGETPIHGTVDSSPLNISAGGNPLTPGDNGGAFEARSGRPGQFMEQPVPCLTQTQRPPLDVNVAYDENHEAVNMGASYQPTTQDFLMISSGKKRRIEDFPSQYRSGYIPQQDGAGDTTSDELKAGEGSLPVDQKSTKGLSSWIVQVDGPVPDQYDGALAPNIFNCEEIVNIEDYNIVTPARDELPAETPVIVTRNVVAHDKTPVVVIENDVAHDDEDEENLNEDDDDDDVDDVSEDPQKEHLVLAQFDKVSRTKNKWKCTLKSGIMHIDNCDTLFNKANGEFEF